MSWLSQGLGSIVQGAGKLTGDILGKTIGGLNSGLGGGSTKPYKADLKNMPQYSNDPGFAAQKNLALNPGPSPWANLATQQQDVIKNQARDQGASSVAGDTAAADANLAATGGLSSGARERVAEGGAKNMMAMNQGVDQTASNNKLQIGMNDQQNKMQQLNSYNDLSMKNYGNQLNAWAAGNTANAIANSGKSGGGK